MYYVTTHHHLRRLTMTTNYFCTTVNMNGILLIWVLETCYS